MSNLTYDDLSYLRSSGFKAGPTGYAWYGIDRQGHVWRAYEDEQSDNLLFSKESENKWGPTAPMNREMFDEQFK